MATKSKAVKPKKSKARHNYELAQQWFVEGKPDDPDEPEGDRSWLNLRQIADELGIPYQRIRERSSMERWSDMKAAYQRQAAKDRQRRRIEEMGKNSIEFDKMSHDISTAGLRIIGVRMKEIMDLIKVSRARRTEVEERYARGDHVDRTELFSVVRSAEMVELARAAESFQQIGRKALGTDIERVQIDAQLEVEANISVAAELERDDPDRLSAFLAAAERAGLLDQLAAIEVGDDDDDEEEDIVDAEVVEDDKR